MTTGGLADRSALGVYVGVELTGDCPCNCTFCYKISKPNITLALPDDDAIRALLQPLKAGGVKAINWTGGEPLWHDKLPRVLQLAKEQFGFTNILSTCGLLKNHAGKSADQVLDYWRGIQFHLDYVSISYDGLHSHTATQSREQMTAAKQFLDWYQAGLFSFRLKVNTLVARKNDNVPLKSIARDVLSTVCVWNLIEYVPRAWTSKPLDIEPIPADKMKQVFAEALGDYPGKSLAIPVFKLHSEPSSDEHDEGCPHHVLMITPSASNGRGVTYWLPIGEHYVEFDPADSSTKRRSLISHGEISFKNCTCPFSPEANKTVYSRYEHTGYETEYFDFVLRKISRGVERLLLEGGIRKATKGDPDDIVSPFLGIPSGKDVLQDTDKRYSHLCEKLFLGNEKFVAFVRQEAGVYYTGLFYRELHNKAPYTRHSVPEATGDLFVSPAFFSSGGERDAWLKQALGRETTGRDGLKALDDKCEEVEKDARRTGRGLSGNTEPIGFADDGLASWRFLQLRSDASDSSYVCFRRIGRLDNLELWTYFCTEDKPTDGRADRFRSFVMFMEGLAVFLLQFYHSRLAAANEATRLQQERVETLKTVDDRVINLIDEIEALKTRAVTLRQVVQPDGPVFCYRAKELIPLFDHGKQVGLFLRRISDGSRIAKEQIAAEVTKVKEPPTANDPKPSDYFVEIARCTPRTPFAIRLTSSHSSESVDDAHFQSFMECIKTFGVFAGIPLLRHLGQLTVETRSDRVAVKELVKVLCQRQIAPSKTSEGYRVIYDAQLICYLLNESPQGNLRYHDKEMSLSSLQTSWREILLPTSSGGSGLTAPVAPARVPVVAILPRERRPVDVLAPLCALVKELSARKIGKTYIKEVKVDSNPHWTKVVLSLNSPIPAGELHSRSESLEGKHSLSSPLYQLSTALAQDAILQVTESSGTAGVRLVADKGTPTIEVVFSKKESWSPATQEGASMT